MEKVIFNTRRQDFFNSLSRGEFTFTGTEVRQNNQFYPLDSTQPFKDHHKVVELRDYVESQRRRNERNKRIWDLKSTIIRLEAELKQREELEKINREKELERQEKLKTLQGDELRKFEKQDAIRQARELKKILSLQDIELRDLERKAGLELKEAERQKILKETLKAKLAKKKILKPGIEDFGDFEIFDTDQESIDREMNNSLSLIDKVKSFMSSNDYNYYLGLGGLGDAHFIVGGVLE